MIKEDQEDLYCQEDIDENRMFIKKAESLVKPRDVTGISFFSDLNSKMPKKIQRAFMNSGKKRVPYMGFIVDPYCFFLSYKINNIPAAKEMLPEGYELIETSLFKGDEKYPMAIAGVFSARTSAFNGVRAEFYIIARNKISGLISWVIVDYETNTNSYDPKNGFSGYSADQALFTTTPFGELLVDIRNNKSDKELALSVDIKKGKTMRLDENLWIEGNLSVDYGGEVKGETSEFFSLIFDQNMMKEAVKIPLENVDIKANSYLSSIIDPLKPENAVIFPYSQHFIIKQDLGMNDLQNQKELCLQMRSFLSTTEFKTMSADDIKKPLLIGLVISSLVNIGIIITLLLLLLL
ncbi:MAG: hypothetical protein FK734_01655 [Asgard group archaeon]|nr:hypothetical protein [Asgard group archaeon]